MSETTPDGSAATARDDVAARDDAAAREAAIAMWSAAAGEAIAAATAETFETFLDLLVKGNRRANLTRIVDRGAARRDHIADALTLLPRLAGAQTVADLGSGGGVPGLVLAIARPAVRFTLVESVGKKADFLRTAAAAMGLANVEVYVGRAEQLGHSQRRESFDCVTARAVAELVWLAEWAMPLLRTGGRLLAMKGPRHAEELSDVARAASRLGCGKSEVLEVLNDNLPGRFIVTIERIGSVAASLPRPATIAKGRPL